MSEECPVEAWTSACVCVSGSVAAVKAPEIAERLLQRGVNVDLVVTHSAEKLLHATYRGSVPWTRLLALSAGSSPAAGVPVGSKRTRDARPGDGGPPTDGANAAASGAGVRARLRLWRDEDEWRDYATVGTDEVLHVELAKRNQLLLVAPLCANTLAAIAAGACGNLLTSVVRAWYYDLDPGFAAPLARRFGAHTVARPVVVAPAMNTIMWHQRVTAEHLRTLEVARRGVVLVPPVSKVLACGDEGVGAMAEVDDVLKVALELLEERRAADEKAAASGLPPFAI